ncbi:MAG TPA: S8 family serine peptidase [Longimicrobiaceae bacterium]|nr:S8 family serine peptidase [Longimicrobiaceae bacterium]
MKQLAFKAVGALAILAVLFVSGIGQSASVRIASADVDEGKNDASRESPTDVVLKLRPTAAIGSVIEKIESWDTSKGKGKQGSKRNGSGNYSVELTKHFPGTDIYLLHLTSGNATALANRLATLKEVVWSEAGIFIPSSEASQFRQVSYERFSQAAYERFSQAAYDQFRQAAYDQFAQAAYDQFRQAAYDQFTQAAYDQFRQAAFERFSQAAYDQFTQAAYERFSQAAFEQFRQAAYDQFTQAAYDRFSQAVYDRFTQAAFERFTQAAFEEFNAAIEEQFRQAASDVFSQAAYDRFSQAAFERFRQVAYEQFTQAAYEQFAQEILERFAQAIYEEFAAAFFEQFTQAIFEQFRQAAYESIEAADLDEFIDATYEQFRMAAYEQFRQAVYDQFRQAVYDSLVLIVASVAEDPDFQLAIQELLVDLIQGIRDDQQSRAVSQTALGQVLAPEAQAVATGLGVVVAVVDTGVYPTHWFLDGAVLPGIDLVDGDSFPSDVGNGIDDNSNGIVDEGVGHGTFIAGLIHLVAPDARILPIRVQNDEGDGWSFLVAEGIYRAVQEGANVVNLSLSIPDSSKVLKSMIDYASDNGVVVVAAAGNDAAKLAMYPAAYEQVIGVGAVDSANQKAIFSNYGNKGVDVVAPGVDLYGPYPVPGTMGMALWSGTSFSTALVSGQAALVYQVRLSQADDEGSSNRRKSGSGTGDLVIQAILQSATSLEDIDPTYGSELGKGLINLHAAVIQ